MEDVLLPLRGLVCWLASLQGFNSALPRFTPAYHLVSLSGFFVEVFFSCFQWWFLLKMDSNIIHINLIYMI